MPWIYFALALGCFAIAFRTHSMGLALISLLAALGLMLAGTLGLAAARISRTTRGGAGLMGPEEMKLIAENMRRKREQEAAAAGTGIAAASASATVPSASRGAREPDAAGVDGGDGSSAD